MTVFFLSNPASKIPSNCNIGPFLWSDFLECIKSFEPEEVNLNFGMISDATLVSSCLLGGIG